MIGNEKIRIATGGGISIPTTFIKTSNYELQSNASSFSLDRIASAELWKAGLNRGKAFRRLLITIDGLSGAGKTTLARGLARHFQIPHLESGYVFKAVLKLILENPNQHSSMKAPLIIKKLEEITLADLTDPDLNKIHLGKLVTIISGQQDIQASFYRAVRRLALQMGSSIVTGRSSGTHVLKPTDSSVSFFLHVSPSVAAYRKAEQMEDFHPPGDTEFATVIRNLKDIDSNLISIPRRAVIMDTNNMTANQVLSSASRIIQAKLYDGREIHT